MHCKDLLLFGVIFLYGSAKDFAQQFPFEYYTPKDGLVNSRVRSIKQDSKGRLYFITYGGLSEYDGSRFTSYNQQDGLASEMVNDLVEIPGDTLLVATNARSLNTLVQWQDRRL
jgi:ligand-binding sensor domain-containing protein